MSHIWLVGGEKGGVGKSTIAVNLAAAMAIRGPHIPTLLDTDESGDAYAWWRERRGNGPYIGSLPSVHAWHDVANFSKRATDPAVIGEVVIDAGGRVSDTLLRAMSIADFMLMPVCPSQFDLFSVKRMAARVEEVRHWNPKLKAWFFLNKGDPRHPGPALEALELLHTFRSPAVNVASTVVCLRTVWQHAARDGMAVFEMKNGDRASEEFWNLLAEVGFDADGGKV